MRGKSLTIAGVSRHSGFRVQPGDFISINEVIRRISSELAIESAIEPYLVRFALVLGPSH
ncbi:MAG: hypothetical protein ACI97A_001323 [Planctomycetota bacterium]|jgi:hypothetical protein